MVFHVLLYLGDELEAVLEQGLEQCLAQISPVPEHLPEEPPCHVLDYPHVTVVHVAPAQVEGQQFALLVHYQVELEPVEPPHRALAPFGQPFEYLVVAYPLVLADPQGRAVYEIDPVAFAKALVLEEKHERDGCLLLQFHEPVVAYQLGEQRFIEGDDDLLVIMLEGLVRAEVETYQDRDDLRIAKLRGSVPASGTAFRGQFSRLSDEVLVFLAEIVHLDENLCNFIVVHLVGVYMVNDC